MLIGDIKFKGNLLETFHRDNLRHPLKTMQKQRQRPSLLFYFVWRDIVYFDSMVGKFMPPQTCPHLQSLEPMNMLDYMTKENYGCK